MKTFVLELGPLISELPVKLVSANNPTALARLSTFLIVWTGAFLGKRSKKLDHVTKAE